jgi:hypothetical protein
MNTLVCQWYELSYFIYYSHLSHFLAMLYCDILLGTIIIHVGICVLHDFGINYLGQQEQLCA